MCVNQGGTNHNCYTQRLEILRGEPDNYPPGHSPPEQFPQTFPRGQFSHPLNIPPGQFPTWTISSHIPPTVPADILHPDNFPAHIFHTGPLGSWTFLPGHFPQNNFPNIPYTWTIPTDIAQTTPRTFCRIDPPAPAISPNIFPTGQLGILTFLPGRFPRTVPSSDFFPGILLQTRTIYLNVSSTGQFST